MPHNLGNVSAQYTARRFTASSDVGYYGKRRNLSYMAYYYRVYSTYATNYSGAVDPYNDYFGWFDPKITANVNATFEVRPGFSLFGRINNLTNDMSGSSDDDYLEQGRSFALGFKIKR